MSYVEKSVYKYIKNVFVSGIKALFTKKFLIYTIFFLVVILTTTLTSLVVYFSGKITLLGLTTEQMINYLFYFEVAFSLAYLLVGFFLSKLPNFIHVSFILLIAGGIITGLYFLDNYSVVSIMSFVLFCLWMMVTVFSTFSFSRNLFGSKVTGSILFMGKKEGGSALFSKILTPLIVACMGLNCYILYKGVVFRSGIYLATASVGIVMGAFILLMIWQLAKTDDVFYTILPFFYLMVNSQTLQLVFRLTKGDTTYMAWTNIVLSVFFLLNSISKYYRKVMKLDLDFTPRKRRNYKHHLDEEPGAAVLSGAMTTATATAPARTATAVTIEKNSRKHKEKKKREEENNEEDNEFYLSDMLKFISDKGAIMLILGFALAYHSLLLQIGFNREKIVAVFVSIPEGIVQLAHCVTIVFAAVVVMISVILYYQNEKFRAYASPAIFRLNFLPEFEKLEKFINEAKAGDVNWKLFARDATIKLAKKGGVATVKLGVAIKEQSVELAKKTYDKAKERTSTLVEKMKNWRRQRRQGRNAEEEPYNFIDEEEA